MGVAAYTVLLKGLAEAVFNLCKALFRSKELPKGV
jgi:hypothetical protein